LPEVVVDTNVLISFALDRDPKQQDLAEELFLRARNGEIVVALPQFIIFEAIYALRTFYNFLPHEITPMIREAFALPGVTVIDDFDWALFFDHWSDLRRAVGDAAVLALAIDKHYVLATFDRKLANRARTFGVAPYW
jgi:predicted nucleic acid-binding protein